MTQHTRLVIDDEVWVVPLLQDSKQKGLSVESFDRVQRFNDGRRRFFGETRKVVLGLRIGQRFWNVRQTLVADVLVVDLAERGDVQFF